MRHRIEALEKRLQEVLNWIEDCGKRGEVLPFV